MAEINQWGQIALGLDDQEQDTLNQALLDLAATDPSIDVTPTAAASAGTSISTSTSESTPERGSGDYEDGGRG
jgi:hypothetical protein